MTFAWNSGSSTVLPSGAVYSDDHVGLGVASEGAVGELRGRDRFRARDRPSRSG